MSLLKWLKNPIFYIRKEAISTTFLKRTEVEELNDSEEVSRKKKVTERDPKDRTEIISVEKSIRYLKSNVYKEAYGEEPVWKFYRRNFKGQFPGKTRRTCIRRGKVSTASPCPICRDENLVVDYKNVGLLKQFTSPYDHSILSPRTTGVCQKQHRNLLVQILKARDYGFLTFDVPFRRYNYSLYTKLAKKSN